MKKATVIIIFLLLGCTVSYSQKIRFTDSSNTWSIQDYWFGNSTPTITTYVYSYRKTDSLIGTTSYKVMQGRASFALYSPFNFFREDTLLNKVYILGCGGAEQVLMDYNLRLGDIFTHFCSLDCTTIDTVVHEVTVFDSVVINSVWHKVWHFNPVSSTGHYPYYPFGYAIIEGIGCVQETLFPSFSFAFENDYTLTCFSNRGISPPVSPAVDRFNNTTSCALLVSSIPTHNNSAIVVPAPANENSKICLSHIVHSGSIRIYNAIGRLEFNITLQDADQILLGKSFLNNGLYIFKIYDYSTGEIISGRFVYQK